MRSGDEERLIDRSKSGDNAAFEALVRLYQDRVYNICRYMLGPSDAEDAAQDSFIKAYRNIGGFTSSPGFSAWLTRITINTCLDYKRKPAHLPLIKKTTEGDEYEREEPSKDPGPEASLAQKQASLAIEEALMRLSEKLRAVVVLREIEELSYEETAAALDVSIGTVKSRLFRAREELRKLFVGSMEHL